ncbi:MAG: hypothetical protein F6K47_21325 [Symploca sp. SIO2E6]|nr:hypothetical protein [Symploca sp. SIO2E6]
MVKAKGNIQLTVIRTQQGLSVSGTRITLYRIMACLKANLSPELIRDRFKLSIQQMNDVLKYIHQNRNRVSGIILAEKRDVSEKPGFSTLK